MIITIKAELLEQQEPGTVRIKTNVESFKEALNQHSPNILIDYLNERWKPGISNVKYKKAESEFHHPDRKEAEHDTHS